MQSRRGEGRKGEVLPWTTWRRGRRRQLQNSSLLTSHDIGMHEVTEILKVEV
jgi:hypothetical protein